jgi:hypothetical protein
MDSLKKQINKMMLLASSKLIVALATNKSCKIANVNIPSYVIPRKVYSMYSKNNHSKNIS